LGEVGEGGTAVGEGLALVWGDAEVEQEDLVVEYFEGVSGLLDLPVFSVVVVQRFEVLLDVVEGTHMEGGIGFECAELADPADEVWDSVLGNSLSPGGVVEFGPQTLDIRHRRHPYSLQE
jgi:hypothetical protein